MVFPWLNWSPTIPSPRWMPTWPWSDTDRLFEAGRDYAVAYSPAEMFELLEWLSDDDAARAQFGAHGLQTIQARHTCAHRADQLLGLL